MDRTLVLIVLLVAVVANILIIGLAILTVRRRGGRDDAGPAQGGILVAMPPASTTRPPAAGLVPSLAGAAASSVVTPATVIIPSPSITTVAAMTDRASDASIPTTSSGRWSLPPHEDPRAEETIHALVTGEAADRSEGPDDGLIDPVTGFATRRAWEEIFRNEEHRLARYGRPVTVLVAELDGLEALAARLGELPADRLIPPVAAALRRNARAADVLARVGHGRFVGLLPETDEVAAINYIERVRAACDMWLAAGAVAVRLAIGWAQAPAGGRLDGALRLADERMNADRRRQARAGTSEAEPGRLPEAPRPLVAANEPAPAAPAAPASNAPAASAAPAASVAPAASSAAATPAAPAASAPAASVAPTPAPADEAPQVPSPGYVPDGPYPGSDGALPAPISLVDAEKTFY